jgi:Type VI secretion system/phage-baseplate injector OB domain
MTQYFGKYRGKVENNIDPQLMGRIQVSCPAVLGSGTMSWAMPSAPYAGPGLGFFAIPPKGANVWVEFEGGNTDFPIWSGCFWALGDLTPDVAIPQIKMFKTDTTTLTLSDLPGPLGGITIQIQGGKKITINMLAIEITDGTWSVKLAPEGVSINGTALVVT